MSTQNFESFKPLSEEEEKHVLGGGSNQNPACAQMAGQITQVQAEIQAAQNKGGQVPQSLEQQLQALQTQYQQEQCSGGGPNPIPTPNTGN